jgi:hypothetical protein
MREDRETRAADNRIIGRSGARFPSPKHRDPDPVPEQELEPSEHVPRHHRPKSTAVGRAGARFPSAKIVKRFDEPPVEVQPVERPQPPAPPQQTPAPVQDPRRPVARFERPEPPEMPEHPGARTLVRPYVITKGRTKSSRHLAIETLVSTTRNLRWASPEVTGEFQSVRALCAHPRSVAEVAANLAVPLGVARVLLGDMADLGLLSVHDAAMNGDGRPALALMERVLHGLQQMR